MGERSEWGRATQEEWWRAGKRREDNGKRMEDNGKRMEDNGKRREYNGKRGRRAPGWEEKSGRDEMM